MSESVQNNAKIHIEDNSDHGQGSSEQASHHVLPNFSEMPPTSPEFANNMGDFYVLDMGDACHDVPILLGRPFLKTSSIKIDVHAGTLIMEFDGELLSSILLML